MGLSSEVSVCEKVESKGRTTYNEASLSLLFFLAAHFILQKWPVVSPSILVHL
jgi:hypothetical protein